MSSTTRSSIAGRQGLDVQSLSFAERVQLGAENAIRCMGVTAQDRVFILTDYYRENIARQVANAALAQHVIPIPSSLARIGMQASMWMSFQLSARSRSMGA